MEVEFLRTATRKQDYPRVALPRIAFAGRSNVGKSSLINSLVGRKGLARTSSQPGRTQALNFFNIDNRWLFVDLPGYGFARVPQRIRDRWGPMIEEFLQSDELLRLGVVVIDARHEPSELDVVMVEYLRRFGVRLQVVATKVDKLSSNRRRQALELARRKLSETSIIPYSSATGEGKRQLWRIIREV